MNSPKASSRRVTTITKSNNKKQIITRILQEKRKKLNIKNGIGKKKSVNKRALKSDTKTNTNETPAVHKSESGSKLPPGIQLSNNFKRSESAVLPEICTRNWDEFKTELKGKDIFETNTKLKKCIERMHGYQKYDLHFTTLHFIRKAIVDSLLSRKWDNLVKLLVMLIKNYSDPVFTMFIRHLCTILKHNHPRIQGTDLEDQIDLIIEKYRNKRNKPE